jgi:hypothetical protein
MTSIKVTETTQVSDRPDAAELPRSTTVVRAFAATRRTTPLLTAAAGLATAHRLRAEAHQRACADDATDHEVSDATRSVNSIDAARTVLVEEIDIWRIRSVPELPTGVLHTESLGQIVDRMAAAWTNWQFLDLGDQPALAREAFRQLGELLRAYDDLIADMHAGRRCLPHFQLA